jgi:multiple sugar transport system permease protein
MVSNWIDKHLKLIFILPALIFVIVMMAFPIIYTLVLSFTSWNMTALEAPQFIGLRNYIELFQNARFLSSVGRTVYFTVVGIIVQTILGVGCAALLHRKLIARNFIKTMFLLPVVATPVAIAMVWMLLFEPSIGYINQILRTLGLQPMLFLADLDQALNSLILVDVWQWTPMIMLIVYAGMAAIPTELYEAATVDGSNSFQKFFRITLPLASPAILVAVLIRLIDIIKTFDIIYTTTRGGPGFATENINIYAFATTFMHFRYGMASAVIMLFFLVVALISGAFIVLKKRLEVDYL